MRKLETIRVFIYTLSILFLLGACVSSKHISNDDVKKLCESEYYSLYKGLASDNDSVCFDVKPGGSLLKEEIFIKEKQEFDDLHKESSVILGKTFRNEKISPEEGVKLLRIIAGCGNDYPLIGLRAKLIVWTDSEYITFTTNDGRYDIRITLLYSIDNKLIIDNKELAEHISKRYDSLCSN